MLRPCLDIYLIHIYLNIVPPNQTIGCGIFAEELEASSLPRSQASDLHHILMDSSNKKLLGASIHPSHTFFSNHKRS